MKLYDKTRWMILLDLIFALAYAALSLYMMQSGNLFSSGLNFGFACAFVMAAMHEARIGAVKRFFNDAMKELWEMFEEIKKDAEAYEKQQDDTLSTKEA